MLRNAETVRNYGAEKVIEREANMENKAAVI